MKLAKSPPVPEAAEHDLSAFAMNNVFSDSIPSVQTTKISTTDKGQDVEIIRRGLINHFKK